MKNIKKIIYIFSHKYSLLYEDTVCRIIYQSNIRHSCIAYIYDAIDDDFQPTKNTDYRVAYIHGYL